MITCDFMLMSYFVNQCHNFVWVLFCFLQKKTKTKQTKAHCVFFLFIWHSAVPSSSHSKCVHFCFLVVKNLVDEVDAHKVSYDVGFLSLSYCTHSLVMIVSYCTQCRCGSFLVPKHTHTWWTSMNIYWIIFFASLSTPIGWISSYIFMNVLMHIHEHMSDTWLGHIT